MINSGMKKRLVQMGKQIRLARLRRDISVKMVAERAGISETSVWAVEKGSPSVSMGIYASVLHAIGLHDDLLKIAGEDRLGHTLQDLRMEPMRKRASRPTREEL